MTINTGDRISIQKDPFPLLRLTSEPCTNELPASTGDEKKKERDSFIWHQKEVAEANTGCFIRIRMHYCMLRMKLN